MKKLIVIGAYPNSPKKEQVLINQINSIKHLDFDIMLVTHYPTSTEVQDIVDYYIYDKNQTLTPLDKTTYFWFKTDYFLVRINNSRHALPICQNMENAFKFSEIKNYDFVYFLENDNLFSENDSNKLSDLVDIMINENKHCIFFKPENYRDNESYVYETQIFGVSPKYFNEKFKLPITEKDFFTNPERPISLELGFYNHLKEYEDDFLIIDQHSYEYFNESKINLFRMEDIVFDLVYNSVIPEKPIVFLRSNGKDNVVYKLIVKMNGEVITDRDILPNYWFYKDFSLNGEKLEIMVYNNNVLEQVKSYILNEDLLINIKNNGIIDLY